jgi:hypothetical protein
MKKRRKKKREKEEGKGGGKRGGKRTERETSSSESYLNDSLLLSFPGLSCHPTPPIPFLPLSFFFYLARASRVCASYFVRFPLYSVSIYLSPLHFLHPPSLHQPRRPLFIDN